MPTVVRSTQADPRAEHSASTADRGAGWNVLCQTSGVTLPKSRRFSADVVSRAAVTGLIVAAPITILSFAIFVFGLSLVEGKPLPAALRAALLTDEDWEILPFWLFGSVVVGAGVAAIAGVVWLPIARRRPARLWLANLAAAGVAAGLSALPYLAGIQWLALCVAFLVGVTALLVAPRVYTERLPSGS